MVCMCRMVVCIMDAYQLESMLTFMSRFSIFIKIPWESLNLPNDYRKSWYIYFTFLMTSQYPYFDMISAMIGCDNLLSFHKRK